MGNGSQESGLSLNYCRNECCAIISNSHAVSVACLNFNFGRWRKGGHTYIYIISKGLSDFFFHLRELFSNPARAVR